MADFCKQCSIEILGEDFHDLSGLCSDLESVLVLCEGCGPIQVNNEGKCLSSDCLKNHLTNTKGVI